MKILICDDEEAYVEILRAHVHEYMANRFVAHEIITSTDPTSVLRSDTRFDLAFLDI